MLGAPPKSHASAFLVASVPGWVGVVAGRDGVRIANLAVAVVDNDLAASQVADDFFGAVLGASLGFVMGAGALSAGRLYVPAAIGVGTT